MHTATTHHTEHGPTQVDDEPILSQQFDDVEQQSEASTLGMWLFLATEVMFFGGLLTAYAVYRIDAPREVALASEELNVVLGCINTVVLLAKQPDDGPGRSRRPVAGASRAGHVAGADDGSRNGLPRDQGRRMDQRLSRAPDPGLELPGPRERPSRSSNKKDSNRERWSCFLFFTSS